MTLKHISIMTKFNKPMRKRWTLPLLLMGVLLLFSSEMYSQNTLQEAPLTGKADLSQNDSATNESLMDRMTHTIKQRENAMKETINFKKKNSKLPNGVAKSSMARQPVNGSGSSLQEKAYQLNQQYMNQGSSVRAVITYVNGRQYLQLVDRKNNTIVGSY